ncbi:hypothetical protein RhiirA1_472224 [Rhizophagus irregularis]|uniref:Uncharacterized protein n=1 Tax=Rhizophagus irregularis TaxID=588596 RepID=A0A2I1FEH5_9GLOM|nr:hypothetical protein RhiirA1_472224 [Rhizophagus irregularis]PKY32790.1 hypothetical protein RhiirB3_451223 [Rhizophagus irregularis]
MCTIFHFGVTLTVLLIFSKLLLPCSAQPPQGPIPVPPSSLGTYTDGTILFATGDVKSPGLSKRSFNSNFASQLKITLHFLNTNGEFKHIDVLCNCDELLDIRPLNPNYLLLLTRDVPTSRNLTVKIMDWTNKILSNVSTNAQIQAIGTSMNGTRFFVTGINATQLLCIEYAINDNEQIIDGIINKSIEIPVSLTINQIISLDYKSWGIIFKETLDADYYNYRLLIISPETENPTPIILNKDRISSILSQIACAANKNFQYYCLFTSYNDLLLVNIHNNSTNQTNLFQSICFDSAKVYTMPNIGFLVEVKTRAYIKYIVLNIDIDYGDPNNAFGESVVDNHQDDIDIDPFMLPNNTIVRILKKDNEYNFLSKGSSIPKKNQENGSYGLFNNTHIKETYPSDNELIPVGTDKIKLTFIHTVDLTAAVNISIYLESDGRYFLRQTLLCTDQYCEIGNNGYSLTINLLDITFNTPNADYSVEIDDKFLRYQNESETIPGIRKGPDSNNYDSDDDSKYLVGIIHLTVNGTNYYQSLNEDEKESFIKQIGKEISHSIPVNESRLNILMQNMFLMILLNYLISIIYLDTNDYTKHIDRKFKPREASSLWDDIRINLQELIKDRIFLAFLIFFIFLLIATYIFGRFKNREGSNFIFFKITLIFVDIVNDISFVTKNRYNLRSFLIPSIIFVVVPLLLNTFLAFKVFIFELTKNSKFKDWFEEHAIFIRIITLFASGNVELLHLLDSKFAGISLFDAPFSPKALYWIFWILYAMAIETDYDNLAFFTLITSSLILITNVIGSIYEILAKKYEKLQKDYTKYMKELEEKEKN